MQGCRQRRLERFDGDRFMKRKVLIVLHQLSVGGVQISCLDALNAIDHSQYDVTLYVRKNRTELRDRVNEHISVIVNEAKKHYYRRPYAVMLLLTQKIAGWLHIEGLFDSANRRLSAYINNARIRYEYKHYLADKQFDVAIAYIGGYEAVLTASAVNAKRKYLFIHGSEDEYHEIQENVISLFDGIIAVNDSIADLTRQWYPNVCHRVSSIENYVDAEIVRRKAMKYPVSREKHTLVLCSCGRYTMVKGFDIAIKSAILLKQQGIDFLWFFVGDGTERTTLEAMLAQNGLENNIILTGIKENPYPYINACDFFVQTSRAEAHSLTLIEAQILGKPCISTKTVGGCVLVRHMENGLLADFTPESIASCIVRLANDSELYNAVVQNLTKIDYEEKRKVYQDRWNALLSRED